MADEVALAQQQVAPHGLQVLQQQVVAVEDVQQVLAGVEVGHVDLLLERPLQVRQQLCGWEEESVAGIKQVRGLRTIQHFLDFMIDFGTLLILSNSSRLCDRLIKPCYPRLCTIHCHLHILL